MTGIVNSKVFCYIMANGGKMFQVNFSKLHIFRRNGIDIDLWNLLKYAFYRICGIKNIYYLLAGPYKRILLHNGTGWNLAFGVF